MTDWTLVVIACCWAAWIFYWGIMAFGTKRTAERAGFFGYRLVALGVIAILIAAGRLLGLSAASRAWHTGLALGIATDILALAGAAFSVWARVTLGRNWSAEVTFKEDHELVASGPYALARHPIYTGMLAMMIATAVNYGRAIGLAFLLSLCAAFWWKARAEERMMSRHFADAYGEYRKRVRAIIPFVL